MKLTDVAVQNTHKREKEFTLHDGGGLYLRIKTNGSKLWHWEYRLLGKRQKLHLGAYPDLSLKDARGAVVTARYQVSQGINPRVQIEERKKAVLETQGSRGEVAGEDITVDQVTPHSPFRSLALAWFNHWKVGKAPKFAKRARNRLTDNVFPVLGGMPISDIKARDLVRLAQSVETRLGRGADLAQRSMQITGQIMRFGIIHGVAERNPAADIKPKEILKPIMTKNQARVDQTQFPALLVAIDGYDGRLIVKFALQLMVLVFLRTGEMIQGVWPEVDLHDLVWRVPGERMKMKKLHLVPLARQAVGLLEKIRGLSDGSPNMFPGEFSKSGRINDNSLLEALEAIGYKGVQTGHGFRGIASTILHERGFNGAHIELQLAHIKRDKVAAADDYALYLDQRRHMMQAWADYVDDAIQRGYEARQGALDHAGAPCPWTQRCVRLATLPPRTRSTQRSGHRG